MLLCMKVNMYYNKVFSDSISEKKCKELYRCYHLAKYISTINSDVYDDVVIKNAFYSIIYCMSCIDSNILNENIPNKEYEWRYDK